MDIKNESIEPTAAARADRLFTADRDSVSAGDDCQPHEVAFAVPPHASVQELVRIALTACRLASIAGGQATWIVQAGGYGGPPLAVVAQQWAAQAPLFAGQPGFAEAFMPEGRAPKPGELVRLPHHGATLEKIASSNGEEFYRGELAAALEAHSSANGGAMRAGDLAAHRADWVETISTGYRGYTVHELPPNGQGIVALIALVCDASSSV